MVTSGSRQPRVPVERIDAFAVAIPLVGPGFQSAHGIARIQKSVVVKVWARDGTYGLGNVDPTPGYSSTSVEAAIATIRERLAPALLSHDAMSINCVIDTIDEAASGCFEAQAAVEMAFIDLVAKHLNIAVHDYLGGAVTTELRFNAWVGASKPAAAAAEADRWNSMGFASAKIKLDGDVRADGERVRAVREAVGSGMKLRVDANGSYTVEDAIALGRNVEKFDVELFEQPVPADALLAMAKVRGAISIPIMADESITDHASLLDVIRGGCADLVKLKVMKQGGLLKCRRMIDTASAAGMRVVIGHGFGLGVNTAAEIALAATSRDVVAGLECVGPLKTADDIVRDKLDLSMGRLMLPPGPGLGVSLDDDKVRQYSVMA